MLLLLLLLLLLTNKEQLGIQTPTSELTPIPSE
jgi:hypothetical protein